MAAATIVSFRPLTSCGMLLHPRGSLTPRNVVCRAAAQDTADDAKSQAGKITLQMVMAQNMAGNSLKDLGHRLEALRFEVQALDGKATVKTDGLQNLKSVEVDAGALEAAGGHEELSKALLVAMQEAHDTSFEATRSDVWHLYRGNSSLMQAPLNQIGLGGTPEDVWVNVSNSEDSVRMAEELFDRFDEDKDGYWNLNETSQVQMATEGTEMLEESFNQLVIATAPDGGRKLSEDDLSLGLSRKQVIELYTDAKRQKQLGFVLDIRRDHATVFNTTVATDATTETAAA